MHKKYISTLPIAPRQKASLEFYCTHVITSALSVLLDWPMMLAVNMTGRRIITKEASENYQHDLKRMGVFPQATWLDNDPIHRSNIEEFLKVLFEKGYLTCAIDEILHCQCGAVEVMQSMLGRKKDLKVLEYRNPSWYCRLCGTRLICSQAPILLLKLPAVPTPKIYPDIFEKEMRDKLDFFANNTLLISRVMRSDNLVARFKEKEYFLDIDFVWSLFLSSSNRQRIEIGAIVCSNHVISRLAYVYAINTAVLDNPAFPEAVITPYCNSGITTREWEMFSPKALRAFVLGMFHSCRKEAKGNNRELYLAEISLKTTSQLKASNCLEGLGRAIMTIEGKNVNALMKSLRQGLTSSDLSEDQLHLLRAIIGNP